MASKNEKAAAKLGISLKAYKASKKSSSKSSSSKDENKATKKIKKYYEEKEKTSREQAELDTKRLQEDLANIYKYAGIGTTRAIEDYNSQIENIEANKALDVQSLNDYLTTNRGRTQEDLDTSLAKENRRYSLEYDKINQDLANRGLTFSERRDETIAKESSALAKADIQTEANRSFQDITRYETAKTAEMALKYGQQTKETETAKARTLEDIANEQQKAMLQNTRNVQDTSIGLKNTLSDISYGKDTDVALTKQMFEKDALEQQDRANRIAVLGY